MAKFHALKNLRNNTDASGNELRTAYYTMVEAIVQGKYEETAEALARLRSTNPIENKDAEIIRRLIAIRLAMKKGDPGENTFWIDIPVPEKTWLAAEKYLVRGHWEYYLGKYTEGIASFKFAAQQFAELGMLDREFVSAFNTIIGQIDGPEQLHPLKQLEELRLLEGRVRPYMDQPGCARVQALIFRQKSHAFEDLNRLHASLEEISKAILIFEIHGPVSDYHLAALHASDICLDLGDSFRAKTFFEYVIPPIDVRVEFPFAFITWRLGGPLPNKSAYSILPGGWKEKFEKLSAMNKATKNESLTEWIWNQKENTLRGPLMMAPIKIKSASLEARLLQTLIHHKATKNLLCETFWPSQSESKLLDNRLHRMISRLNKKLGNLIEFDGKYYLLKANIRLV